MALPHPDNPVHSPLHIRLIGGTINAGSYLSTHLGGAMAYAVLAAPRRRPPTKKETQFLAKAQKDWIQVNKMRIQTYHWGGSGKGPSILLAHGWDSHSGRWQPQAERLLAKDCTLYALDAPAHGESQSRSFNVAYYSEAIEAVATNIQPDILIGHSAGGMASVYYLYKKYEQKLSTSIKRLVLLATPAHLHDFLSSFRDTLQLAPSAMNGLEQQFYKRFHHGFDYYDTAAFAQKLAIPGLLIHDETDNVIPVASAYRFHELWSNSELMLTQGLGHSTQSPVVWERVTDYCLG